MKAAVPITFRLPSDLKAKAETAARSRRLSLNAFVELALQNETASACLSCGQPSRHVPRGVSAEFSEFVERQRGSSLYVRLERRDGPVVYKGRLPRVYGRHLHLDAESATGEQVILLDEIVDWAPARSGAATLDWDSVHPGIPVDGWGLTPR